MEQHEDIDSVAEESHSSCIQKREPVPCYPWSPYRYHACVTFYRARLVTVEPVVFLFMFASFLRDPLYEQYYYVNYGSQILENTSFPFPNGSFCLNSSEVDEYAGNGSYKTVETWSNNLVVYGEIASRVPSVIITILLGPLSDRIGRKPVLFLAALGSALEGILSIMILHFKWSPYYFIAAYFLGGMFGSFTGVLAASFSYITDVSSEKWRGFRIGVAAAFFSIGVACGEFSVGFWLQWNNCDFIQPMWLFTACNIAVLFYVTLCIPESLTRAERKELAAKTPRGFTSLTHGISLYIGFLPHYITWKLWAATLVAGVLVFNVAGTTVITVYFLKAPPFDLDALMIGAYQSSQAVSKALSNTFLMGIFSVMKMPEAAIAIIAVLFSSGSNLLIGFSTQVWQLFTVGSIQGVESISWTALRTLVSKLVAPQDIGSIFAILASLESLCSLASSVAWPNIYNVTINHNLSPGTTFKIMAGVSVIALLPLIALLIFRRTKYDHQNYLDPEKEKLLHSAGSLTQNGVVVYGKPVASVNRQ